ncbi:amidophosphoribosyltransferase [Candidatus Pacearchaeota archaeon]|nr:amidophosphoribosyltransferase [Candidatus Pacearchaeota archaeon]
MSGIFGVVSKVNCARDVFYGTDYHSHLGTEFGGMAILPRRENTPKIETHGISRKPFRPQFEDFVAKTRGRAGIGAISDYERQPVIYDSHIGNYALVHVGKVANLRQLVTEAHKKGTGFSQTTGCLVNPTEVVAYLLNQGHNLVEGIEHAQQSIISSSSMMILKRENGRGVVYVARDLHGRTPLVIGKSKGAMAATLESCAFSNLGFETVQELKPGEIGRLTAGRYEQLKPGDDKNMQICAFLWIYFGYPASSYEGVNVEEMRYRCGAAHARLDMEAGLKIDSVAGIPDSGTGHALGYSNFMKIPHERPFVKYTPTWPRSFMPQSQRDRDLVAKMKLIPIRELIEGRRLLFCEDSIVRGTQLKDTIQRLYDCGAREVHMRPACPPLTFGCKFLNFSRSKSQDVLAGRKAIRKIEGDDYDIAPYLDESSEQFAKMVEVIRQRLGLTSLRYQKLDDLVSAIGLPREKLCLGCWRP